MPTQSLIVHIDASLARRVRAFLAEGSHGYESLSEFAEVSLLNQLEAEATNKSTVHGDSRAAQPDETINSPATELLAEMAATTSATPLYPPPTGDALFVLTNRLSPLKLAVRVLANLGTSGEWPTSKQFHEAATAAARRVGMALRERDKNEVRSGSARLSTGYPIGKDAQAALERFIFSFTASIRDGYCVGPLATLGLVNCDGEKMGLTAEGLELAMAKSPILDGQGDKTLSEEEARIFREQICKAELELAAVREFLRMVKKAAGSQGRLDELLSASHADWSSDLTVAHRSAMLGRLADAQALTVVGRGPTATIKLSPEAETFEETRLEEAS